MAQDGGRNGGALPARLADGNGDASIAPRRAPPATRHSLVDEAEQAVRDWLRPGRFREGDRLPTEEQLAKMLGISRGTLRSALRRLEDSGEILRRQGSGTFVGQLPTGPRATVPWLRADSYGAWAPAGTVSVTAMSVELGPAGESAGAALQIDRERSTVRIRRVLAAGDTAVAVSHDVLHPDLPLPDVSTLRAEMRGGGTVHAMIVATTGIAFSLKRTRIASLLVDPGDVYGRLLALADPVACVMLEEVSVGAGQPIHWARDVVIPGHVEIEVVQSAGDTRPTPIAERGLSR